MRSKSYLLIILFLREEQLNLIVPSDFWIHVKIQFKNNDFPTSPDFPDNTATSGFQIDP